MTLPAATASRSTETLNLPSSRQRLTLQVSGSGNERPLPEAETFLPAPPALVNCVPPPLLPPGGIPATLRREPHPGKCCPLPLDSNGGGGAEKVRGIGQEMPCAWSNLDKDTYLALLSLKGFSRPLCEMITQLTKFIHLLNWHLLCMYTWQTLF